MARPSPLARHLHRNATAYLVLVLGLGLTLAAAVLVARLGDIARERRFDAAVEDVRGAIEQRLGAYIAALRGVRGLLELGLTLDRVDFRRYVASLELDVHYPGIQGIGFVALVPREEREAHEAAIRAEGLPDYRVWPPGERSLHAPVALIEPSDWRNRRALGFDMFSEPTRRQALERARDSGEPAASAGVTLVQETGEGPQPGFLIFVPVYARGAGDGRGALRGWVYAPFRAGDLFQGIFGAPGPAHVHVEIFDGEGPDRARLLYDDDETRLTAPGRLHRVLPLEIAGRRWTLLVAPAGFEGGAASRPPVYVLGMGLLITLLLTVISRDQIKARATAEETARRSAFLAEAGVVLSSSLDLPTLLDHLARLCVPTLADWCTVEMREGEGPIQPVAIAHVDPGRVQWAREVRRRFTPKAGAPLDRVLRSGRPELHPVVTDAMLAEWARAPEHLEVLRRAGIRSYMCVPLVMRGGTLGAVAFASHQPGRYGELELALARELAGMAAAAVDNARLYDEAQQAIRLREEFLSIAAHELRTPLTSMQLNVQRLRGLLPAEVRERLTRPVELLERQTGRLGKLVNQLLDVTRVTRQGPGLELEEVDLSEVAREVTSRMGGELTLAGCTLELEVDGPMVGRWDRLRLEQVLHNLLSNAMKYGAGRPIHLSLARDGPIARVRVRDEGIGIPPEDLERIFGRFERAVPSRHYGGLGLGLFIARRIVEAHGGVIRVESRPEHGSTFTVELPLEGPTPGGGEGTSTLEGGGEGGPG